MFPTKVIAFVLVLIQNGAFQEWPEEENNGTDWMPEDRKCYDQYGRPISCLFEYPNHRPYDGNSNPSQDSYPPRNYNCHDQSGPINCPLANSNNNPNNGNTQAKNCYDSFGMTIVCPYPPVKPIQGNPNKNDEPEYLNYEIPDDRPDDGKPCVPQTPSKDIGPTWGEETSPTYHDGERNGIYYCQPVNPKYKCIKSYKLMQLKVTHSEAEERCKYIGHRLASIVNVESWQILQKEIADFKNKNKGSFSWWISAKRNPASNVFVWGNGCPVKFNNWDVGEPNNFKNRPEHCAEIRNNDKWNDEPCDRKKYYICEARKCQNEAKQYP